MRRCAPTAPSSKRRARATSPAGRRCRTISATGGRRSNSCSARSAAARSSRKFRPLDFAEVRRTRRRCLLPAGFRHAARQRSPRASRSKLSTPAIGDRYAAQRRRWKRRKARSSPRAAIVTASTNVIASGAIKFTPELPARQLDAFGKLSLGSYDHIALELAGQSARPRERRSGVREIGQHAHRRDPRQRVRHAAVLHRSRRQLRPRSCRPRAKRRWSISPPNGSPASTAPTSRRRSSARTPRAGTRSRGRSAPSRPRRPGGQSARRILMEPVHDAVWFAGEAAARDAMGHRRRRLGIRRARRRRGAAPARRREGAGRWRETAGHVQARPKPRMPHVRAAGRIGEAPRIMRDV